MKRIEAAQGWLFREQRAGFDRIESLFLPLLSFASDELGRNQTLKILIRAESERVIDTLQDESEKTRAHADQRFDNLEADIGKLVPQPSNAPEPLIQTLPTQQDIEGREEECKTILRAMSESEQHVLAFAAPGGFGKTALLGKVVRKMSADGRTFRERFDLANGETIEPKIGALLHVDCRNDVKLSVLFANAGRLVGQEQPFQDIYNSDATLADKLQEIFSRLSGNAQRRAWFVFDNFDLLLNDKREVRDEELRDFFSAIFAGGQNVYVLIAGREVPRFSPREKILELETVGGGLFEGLPLEDCLAFLKKNGAAEGLEGSAQEVDSVLKEFSLRVHRIPLALVWAIGYSHDTGYTLKQVLDREDLFADFDEQQAKDAERYENKGVKRLHYEQLKIQANESLPLLRLLAFFKRAVPKGALAHLLSEIELNKALIRLERNKLITRKESSDAYSRYLNDPLAINLHGLHPVICENQFFDTLPEQDTLYETAANECRRRAESALKVNRFAYAVELFDCSGKLYEYLTRELGRASLLNNCAAVWMNKGVALQNLTKLSEAIGEYDKAIAIRESLVTDEQQALANDLAGAYMNKGVALHTLTKLAEAIAEYDKALRILQRRICVDHEAELANKVAAVYMNKGNAFQTLTKSLEALAEYDKAIAIRERLVNEKGHKHLANDLAAVYGNKGIALKSLTKLPEAIAEYDKAVAVFEFLVNEERQTHLADDLASAHINKGIVLQTLTRSSEALAEYDKAITILEHLVNGEQQGHLALALASAYINKGVSLGNLTKLPEAIAEHEKAVAILWRLVYEERQAHLASDLAGAYISKGNALESSRRLPEAITEFGRAVAILEQLVLEERHEHLASDLASAYMNRGIALRDLNRWPDAITDYDKAIAILERLIVEGQQLDIVNQLARAHTNKGVSLRNLNELTEAIGEYDKAIAILERLVNEEQQGHLTIHLAKAYINKGVALKNLTLWADAVVEYDKAISILERLVNEEQQGNRSADLAMAYTNKGNALQRLDKVPDGIVEYDKAIAILERLVEEGQQYLFTDLAPAYLNKAIALSQKQEWDSALFSYQKSLQSWAFCVDHLSMFWLMPRLLITLRYQFNLLRHLQRWSMAAQDIRRFRSLYGPFLSSAAVDAAHKEAAGNEFAELIADLRALNTEQLELLYTELGREAPEIRLLVSGPES